MDNNLVSIIIPVYNLEDYIKKCMDSIISQTINNIEILIIDDGSTDSTLEIIEEYCQKDVRFKLLKSDHQGTASARKLGIEFAHGDFLTFVDGDDWLEYDAIENMLNSFQNSCCDIVVAQHRRVFTDDETKSNNSKKYPFDIVDSSSFMQLMNERRDFTLWAKMFKKELFDNIQFHVGVPIGQDGLVLKQAVLKSSKIKAINKVVYNYLFRVGSAMGKSKLLINQLQFLRGSFNNLNFYTGDLYEKERDKLLIYWMGLGEYYLKMKRSEKSLFMQIWIENIYRQNIHLEIQSSNPIFKKLSFIQKYPVPYSLLKLTPFYFNLVRKKLNI